MGYRSRSRLAADWFAKLRVNETTQEVEHEDVTDVQTNVATTVEPEITAVQDSVIALQTTVNNTKQDVLVSGTNIKTFNGASMIGSGNLTAVVGGSTGMGATRNTSSGSGSLKTVVTQLELFNNTATTLQPRNWTHTTWYNCNCNCCED